MGELREKEHTLPRSAAINGAVVQPTDGKSTGVPLTPFATVTNGTTLVSTTTCSPFMSAPAAAECSPDYLATLSEEGPDTIAEGLLESTAGGAAANATPVATQAPAVSGAEWSPMGAPPGEMGHEGVVLGTPEDTATSSICCSLRQRRSTTPCLVDGSRLGIKPYVEAQRQTTGVESRKPISRTRHSPTRRCISACERTTALVSAATTSETWWRNMIATEAPTKETATREARHRCHRGAGGDVTSLDSFAFSAHSSENATTRDAHGVPAPTPPHPPKTFSSTAARVFKDGSIEIPDMAGAKIDTVGLNVTVVSLLAARNTSQRSRHATGPPMVIRSFSARSQDGSKRDSTTPLPGIGGGASATDTVTGGRGGGAAKTQSTQSAILAVSPPSSPLLTFGCSRCKMATRAVSPRAWNGEDNNATSLVLLSWDSCDGVAHIEGEDNKGRLVIEDDGGQEGAMITRSPAGGGSPFFPVRPVYRRGSPRGFGSPRVLGSSSSGKAERGCTVRVSDAVGLQTEGGLTGERGRCADGGRRRGR